MSRAAERAVGIITGGASGIGAATALEFARRHSARLVIGVRPGDDTSSVAEAISHAGAECMIVESDVRDPHACEALADAARNWGGRIDFVHANAGIADQSSIADGDPDVWRNVVETNLLGAAFTVRAALPTMIKQRSGHVFLTASTSGREIYVGEPLYLASKWGLVGFGYAARMELSRHNIRVTLVEPGIVDSPLTRDAPAVAPLLETTDPLVPDDIARAIVFAYEQASRVNVSEIVVVPTRDINS